MAKTPRSTARNTSAKPGSTATTCVKIFVSYAHSNKVWMDRLRVFLDGFQYDDRVSVHRIEYLHVWHDNELAVGNPWDGEIKRELLEMDIFVPLVSPHFFQSWYIQNVELPYAMDRHATNEILVVPILLYDINLRQKCAFLHSFSTLPTTSDWWSKYADVNDAYRCIDDGLWKAIHETLHRKSAKPG